MSNFTATIFTGKTAVTLKTIFGAVGGFASALASAAIPGIPLLWQIGIGVGGFALTYLSAHAFHAAEQPIPPLAKR